MNPWDLNAERRAEQIKSGVDLSYDHVLTPAILQSLPKPDGRSWSRLLDAGCGPGILSERLWRAGWKVTAIDGSAAMIDVARRASPETDNLRFVAGDFNELPALFGPAAFDAVVANMSLTGVTDVRAYARALRRVLRRRGVMVVTDVHPWFWRQYKAHHDLSYWETVPLIEPFTISLDPQPLPAPIQVVYRPLHRLFEAMTEAGFVIQRVAEPRPVERIEEKYPERWRFPRFIALTVTTK